MDGYGGVMGDEFGGCDYWGWAVTSRCWTLMGGFEMKDGGGVGGTR